MVFPSGPFTPISLPPNAPIADLVAKSFKYSFGDQAVGTNSTIVTNRLVRIWGRKDLPPLQNTSYFAALVDTNVGQRIVLQFQRDRVVEQGL